MHNLPLGHHHAVEQLLTITSGSHLALFRTTCLSQYSQSAWTRM
ncbi:MAG: hypothetical protein ACRCY4_02850 [Brevinema sp.]